MSAALAGFAPLRFSTRELPERERIPTWREEFGRNLLRVDIEPLSDLPFHAEATLRVLPGLRTVAGTGSATRFERTAAMAAGGDGFITLIINAGESCTASQRGREVALGAGGAVALLHEEAATVTFAAGSYLGVCVPRAALAARMRGVDDATMKLIPHATEPLRLLAGYLSLTQDDLLVTIPRLRRVVVTHIHDLVALALGPQGAAGVDGVSAIRAARLKATLDQIAACFQEPDLCVAAVAHRQGISPRYLQRLLETAGTSFTTRVNELRLQRAFALLSGADHRRICDIALEVGFSDLSHFNRMFRARFGETPTGIRAQAARRPGDAAAAGEPIIKLAGTGAGC
jgi:AraC-like DNA-binding protein